MTEHMVGLKKSGRFRSKRFGRFPRNWSARCSCGWRGPGHTGPTGWNQARFDLLEHLDETR